MADVLLVDPPPPTTATIHYLFHTSVASRPVCLPPAVLHGAPEDARRLHDATGAQHPRRHDDAVVPLRRVRRGARAPRRGGSVGEGLGGIAGGGGACHWQQQRQRERAVATCDGWRRADLPHIPFFFFILATALLLHNVACRPPLGRGQMQTAAPPPRHWQQQARAWVRSTRGAALAVCFFFFVLCCGAVAVLPPTLVASSSI